ncbi:MAG: 2-oxo acid dehydrogenase subunit E2 [Gammaproteobacteria bacterium AqS3]|nr:2-oxo acid dehydrogenase subunit E2 [Gammaproteobacteria bacterium AqS3]
MAGAPDQLCVPDLGEIESAEITELSIAPGAAFAEGDTLAVLESDKASFDLPAPCDGVLRQWLIEPGTAVGSGDVLADLEATGAGAAAEAEGESDAAPELGAVAAAAAAAANPEPEGHGAAAPEPQPAAAEATVQPLSVPDLGEIESAEIIELVVAPGGEFAEGDTLAVLESEKASFDLPAPGAGELLAWKVALGDAVAGGDVLGEWRGVVQVRGGAPVNAPPGPAAMQSETSPPVAARTAPAATKPAAPVRPSAATSGGPVYAGPGARKLARQLGVDLSEVAPSGARGRIQIEDIHAYVRANLGAGSELLRVRDLPDFSGFGVVRRQARSRIDRTAADNLHRSWVGIPHVTHHDEADVTEMEALRRRLRSEDETLRRLTGLSFLVVACVRALREFPKFRASLDERTGDLVIKEYFHIGIAVDTERGLLVPVLRGADALSLGEISDGIADLAGRARAGQLKLDDMRGACFSISNLGGIGGTGFTPIINPPEVAILGVARTGSRVFLGEDGQSPRESKLMPLSLSYNHKVINGVEAARFVRAIAEQLRRPEDLT